MALSTEQQRSQLESYAKKQLGDVNTTKAQAFVNILDFGKGLVSGLQHPAMAFINDLKAVLVGDDRIPLVADEYTIGRGHGPYYAGDFPGSSGFKAEFKDSSYQVQHAMAGIAISYEYQGLAGLAVESFLPFMEQQGILQKGGASPQDAALYKATFAVGNKLTDANYVDLPRQVANAIGDGTVHYGTVHYDPFLA